MKKITVIGDIMCEPPFFEQVKQQGMDFHFAFDPLKKLLDEADLAIGNLETPLAGEEAGFTSSLVSFNTPDTIVDALKDAGLDVLVTANNHSLDRQEEGLYRTLRVLDEKGVPHTGTYASNAEAGKACYVNVGDLKLAILSYTYGTNMSINKCNPDKEHDRIVNLMRPITARSFLPPVPPYLASGKAFVAQLLGRPLTWEEGVQFKKALLIPVAYCDDLFDPEEAEAHMTQMEADIREAKKNADLVIVCPHMGGQFGTTPGKFTLWAAERIRKAGADAVMAAHSHTTQKGEIADGVPSFYSLGNVSMFPGSSYAVMESLPEYGIAAHLYIEDKKITKTTFSLFKIVGSPEELLHVVPVDELWATLDAAGKKALEEDVKSLLLRITEKEAEGDVIRREYELA